MRDSTPTPAGPIGLIWLPGDLLHGLLAQRVAGESRRYELLEYAPGHRWRRGQRVELNADQFRPLRRVEVRS